MILESSRETKPGQKGQGLLEYALIIMFIAIALVLVISLVPEPIIQTLDRVFDWLP